MSELEILFLYLLIYFLIFVTIIRPTCALETERKNKKPRQMLKANGMKVLRKIVNNTKIDRMIIQQIRESCGICGWKEEEEEENGTYM